MPIIVQVLFAETKVKVAEIALPGTSSTTPAKYVAGLCQL